MIGSSATIKSTPLMIDDILYFATPDHAWAVDARTGREIWHYLWKSTGGNHLANRGVAILGDKLYFETPDDYLSASTSKTARSAGTSKWRI